MYIIVYMIYAIALYFMFPYLLRAFTRFKYNINFENKTDHIISLLFMSVPFFILCYYNSKHINDIIKYCSKYSFIIMFLFLQIYICFTMIYFICFIKLVIEYIKQSLICVVSICILKILYIPIKNNTLFDPFYKIPDVSKNTSSIYNLKATIFASYLLSGLIVISPVYNYIIGLNEAKEYLVMLKNDYDAYKSIFIVSLIPYFLNFIIINRKDYLKEGE